MESVMSLTSDSGYDIKNQKLPLVKCDCLMYNFGNTHVYYQITCTRETNNDVKRTKNIDRNKPS